MRIEEAAYLACAFEATARKLGNVHVARDFADLTYRQLMAAGAATAKVLAGAPQRSVGQTVLQAITATRRVVATNANLGIVLLLTPLGAREAPPTPEIVEAVLAKLEVADAINVYSAIRLAQPGGLGAVADQDVGAAPTLDLRSAMCLAQDRDLIARQYANGFREVFEVAVPELQRFLDRGGSLEAAILSCQLTLLSHFPDSLIVRKWGNEAGAEVRRRAAQLRAIWRPDDVSFDPFKDARFQEFDAWLCEPRKRRNPGTTADLIAAALFVLLRHDRIGCEHWLPAAPSCP